ncbi:hypothetical protein BCR35DRAFT_328747 [Leucosporidium creatinivorum]|uniref:Uncharacterized protein n=1 Tax=Leucosporidium creatinivorum TaxID=106004 RepID=A0A1Y2G256_9BASI|nr:hypothetical protein BCR35DRAFT_328747 [Leucosporidium creatinivorum]
MSLAPYIPGYDDNTPFVLLAATGHLGLEAPFVPAPQTAAGENSSCVYPFCKHAGLAQETTAELHYEHWHIFHVPSLPRNQLKGTEWFDVFPSGKVKGGASPRYPLASGKRHIARQAYLLLLQRRILKVLGIDFDPELLPRTCVVTRNLLVRPEVLLTVLKNAEERKQKEEEEGRLKEAKTSSAKQRELGRDDPSSYEPSSDDDVAHHLMAHQKPAAGLDQQISEPKSEQAAFRSALEASKAKLSKLQDKLQDKEKTCRRLEKLLVQRDQQLKEGRAAKTEAAKKISNITAERNNFKKALDRAHSDVVLPSLGEREM